MAEVVTVIGNGGWGTAFALLLDRRGCDVTIYGHDPRYLAAVEQSRENRKYLPGVEIPRTIHFSADPCQATTAAELVFLAVPVQYLRKVLSKFSGHLARTVPVIGLAKGIEVETFLRPSEICQATCGVVRHAVISGPSHAEEVARRRPTSVVAASDQVELASQLQQLLSDEVFRVYSHDDLIGVELAGALKNIIGIAGGICDGLELGDNAKAALLTRGIVEISRFGMALGSRRETFSGLAGVGDLITTCFSRHGRNRHVGELLGRGQDLAQVLASMEMIAEGIPTTQAVLPRARLLGIDMPITEAVYRVLFEGLDARAAIRQVMERDRKEEHDRV